MNTNLLEQKILQTLRAIAAMFTDLDIPSHVTLNGAESGGTEDIYDRPYFSQRNKGL
jgi:hypothetical protein